MCCEDTDEEGGLICPTCDDEVDELCSKCGCCFDCCECDDEEE
jgi:hypothetical protein